MQVLPNQAGTVSYFRQCPISYTLGIRSDYCTPWWERDLTNLRGIDHESYGTYAGWIEPKSTGDIFGQSFIARDGIDVSRCGGFSELPPFAEPYVGAIWSST